MRQALLGCSNGGVRWRADIGIRRAVRLLAVALLCWLGCCCVVRYIFLLLVLRGFGFQNLGGQQHKLHDGVLVAHQLLGVPNVDELGT